MATEIALIPLAKGKSPEDANSPAGQAWKDVLDTLTQQEGFQRAYWGTEVENQDTLRLFVDWDSVDHHKKFAETPQYKPFFERLSSIMEGGPTLFHTHFYPHPAVTALSDVNAPVTEILTFYFPTSYSEADQKKFEDDLKKFISVLEEHASAYTGSAGGWVEEEIDVPGTSEKAKGYVAVLGWKSVEQHTAYQDTQHFKDSIGGPSNAKDKKMTVVVHAHLKEVQGGGGVAEGSGAAAGTAQEEILNPQGGGKQAPKTRADGTTTKNTGDPPNANATKKEKSRPD